MDEDLAKLVAEGLRLGLRRVNEENRREMPVILVPSVEPSCVSYQREEQHREEQRDQGNPPESCAHQGSGTWKIGDDGQGRAVVEEQARGEERQVRAGAHP